MTYLSALLVLLPCGCWFRAVDGRERRYMPEGSMAETWSEKFVGGTPETERVRFEQLAREIMLTQLKNQKHASRRGVPHAVDRAFHAKSTFTIQDAELRFLEILPDLQVEFAQPGAVYATVVRFSNAAGRRRPDYKPDLRSVALRIKVSAEQQHDLLMTNYPASHARDARQLVKFANATAGGTLSRVFGLADLALICGFSETVRMLRTVSSGCRREVRSIATETYRSPGAIRWGDTLAVRYLLRPTPDTLLGPEPSEHDPEYLSHEIARRLAQGDVRFELCLQRFVDSESTPIEDTAVAWLDSVSPPEPIAVLTISKRIVDVDGKHGIDTRVIDSMAFNPWNTTDSFHPLGNLNRACKAIDDASDAHRLGLRWRSDPPLRNVVLGAGARAAFRVVNRFVEWHRLPMHLGVLNLAPLREVLRRRNLIDTDVREAPPKARPVPLPPDETVRVWRTFDGRHNDLSEPQMGAVGSGFGRNLTPDYRPALFDEPNPIVVSQQLLHRKTFLPARSLNVLAAAWIQFQVHDWAHHARYPLGQKDVRVPLPPGMAGWSNTSGGPLESEMRIAGDIPLGDDRPDGLQRFANSVSHWWDASEVYGVDVVKAGTLREGAKLKLTEKGYLPTDVKGSEITGFSESWWLGLSSMHTLFAREHNALCDELRAHYRGWNDDQIYHTARLIVSALIAKIHTVEWTPAILATETVDLGIRTSWNGPPANDWMTKLGLWLLDQHASVGIPSTLPDHHAVPYSMTEEFITIYRMHPLLPDDYSFFDYRTGGFLGQRSFLEIQGDKADDEMRAIGLHNALYSFGISHPGAITLHNYPRSLQAFDRDGERIDLSVVDLVRTRQRGIPRYNDFRAGLHKPRITKWEDLCANPESVQLMRHLYRSIDEVDTMIGLFAETPPEGFGFSDTAFRIFLLMAARRVQSDRFLTVDFRPEIYSPLGMDWIANNGMTSVILRHFPELAAVLPRGASAFAPWRPIAQR
jgi:hypothetical protein